MLIDEVFIEKVNFKLVVFQAVSTAVRWAFAPPLVVQPGEARQVHALAIKHDMSVSFHMQV